MSRLTRLAVLGAALATPVVVKAPDPTPPGGPATVDALVASLSSSTLTGWELVDEATRRVNASYRHCSAWHLWESPATSLANGRGLSNQYNSVLGQLLTALGFEVDRVHAARVRLDRGPWWHSGHTWLQVTIDGRRLDVCASRSSNRAGEVAFTPVTPVRPFSTLTYVNTTLGLVPFVTYAVWQSLLTGDKPPRWLYRSFGEQVELEL